MIYKRIQSLREGRQLREKQLAEYLGIPLRTYSEIESGDTEITPAVVAKLAVLYGTSADYILELTDEKSPYPPPHYPVNTE